MKPALAAWLACLAILHTPDGREIRIDVRHVAAVRPADAVSKHLAPGTRAVVYVTTNNFGVRESVEEVQRAIHNCVDGDYGDAPE